MALELAGGMGMELPHKLVLEPERELALELELGRALDAVPDKVHKLVEDMLLDREMYILCTAAGVA
jgi:hypothetical protein